MGILKQHLCPTPEYDRVRLGSEPDDWYKYWQCDACNRVWTRAREDDWNERWVEVPLEGSELFWAKLFRLQRTKEVRRDIFPKRYWTGWKLVDSDVKTIYVEREDGAVTPMSL